MTETKIQNKFLITSSLALAFFVLGFFGISYTSKAQTAAKNLTKTQIAADAQACIDSVSANVQSQCNTIYESISAYFANNSTSGNAIPVDCRTYDASICASVLSTGHYSVLGTGTTNPPQSSGTGTAGSSCTSSTSCNTGLTCVANKCGVGCTLDTDCQSGQICDLSAGVNDGVCQAKTNPSQTGGLTGGTGGTPTTPTGGTASCNQGSCPAGLCSAGNGLCLPPQQITTGLAATKTLPELITNIVKILLLFAGSVAVVVVIMGGFWYMTSGGNEEQAEKGKKTIFNFVLGLAVIILAYTLVTILSDLLTSGKYL